MIHATQGLGYHWQWYRIPAYVVSTTPAGIAFGPLLQGLGVTLKITAVSLVLAFLIGLTTALMRLSGSVLGRLAARIYLELVRNTPLLVQIFFIYFVLSPALGLERLPAAILALSLFEGAYTSEILRAGSHHGPDQPRRLPGLCRRPRHHLRPGDSSGFDHSARPAGFR
jgi:polar amino acid transport system permease protein